MNPPLSLSVRGSCHCGGVHVAISEQPQELISCNCSLCRRVGGLWAYYRPDQVQVTGPTVGYVQGDRTLTTHHCGTCGCTTHWSSLDPTYNRMGINARMLDPAVVAAARVRKLDGADTWKFLDEE